jgi:peroxiredoxin
MSDPCSSPAYGKIRGTPDFKHSMHAHPIKSMVSYTAVAALTLLVGLLLREINALRVDHRMEVQRLTEPQPGIFIPSTPLRSVAGRPVTVGSPASGRQLLIFFTETCSYCRASIPAWRQLANSLDSTSVEIVGVSFDSAFAARSFAESNTLPFEVVSAPDPRVASLYRILRVPLIMVVDQGGQIVYSRPGLLESRFAIDSVLTGTRTPAVSPTIATHPNSGS